MQLSTSSSVCALRAISGVSQGQRHVVKSAMAILATILDQRTVCTMMPV